MHRVLRLKLEVPDPSCLNAAEVNRLASGLNCGPVIRVEEKADGVCEVWINHPSVVCPAIFVIFKQGMIPTGISEHSRQVADSNLAAWLDLVVVSREATAKTKRDARPAKHKKTKKTRNRRSRIAELLLVLLEDRTKANLNCTELAEQLECSVSAISRAFRHEKYGAEILRRYRDFGVPPPGIHQI